MTADTPSSEPSAPPQRLTRRRVSLAFATAAVGSLAGCVDGILDGGGNNQSNNLEELTGVSVRIDAVEDVSLNLSGFGMTLQLLIENDSGVDLPEAELALDVSVAEATIAEPETTVPAIPNGEAHTVPIEIEIGLFDVGDAVRSAVQSGSFDVTAAGELRTEEQVVPFETSYTVT